MKKFSLLLNSRARPKLLENLLNSILWQTADPDSIECLISCDEDDLETKKWLNSVRYNQYGGLPEFAKIYSIFRERNLHKRINDLVPYSSGKYLWFLNDDCLLTDKSKNWDLYCYELLQWHKDKIVYGHIKCTSVDKEKTAQYSSFPIISREVYNIVGYAMPESLPGLGGDVFWWRIFSQLNRIINLPIEIRHTLHESIEQVINCDQTAAEMRQQTSLGNNCWTMNVSKEVEKLKNAILS